MIHTIIENKDFDYNDDCGPYRPEWHCQGCLFTGTEENLKEFQEWLAPYGCSCEIPDNSDSIVFLHIRDKNNYLITVLKGNYFLYKQDPNFFLSCPPKMLEKMFKIKDSE